MAVKNKKLMRVTFRTFESGAGDCIFLVIKDAEGHSHHLMVDCNVLTDDIKAFIREDLGKRIDTLIVTHIDSDHANGITKLLRSPEFADLQIGQILFNGFQPQTEQTQALPQNIKEKLETVAQLLPPTVDEAFLKTNGMDAACLITELNKHPQWKAVWRKEPIMEGEFISLGEEGKWGMLRFLSPTQNALVSLLHEVKLEYARRLSAAPPDGDFEDQDKYFELMLRLVELRERPSCVRKTCAIAITKGLLERYAITDGDERSVTLANKASIAFCWEGGVDHKRILMMGDAVSSQVVKALKDIDDNPLWFEAVKVSHHGSKHNTSVDFCKRVNSSHFFLTGGKEGEGPHIETIAKIAKLPLLDGQKRRELHYNHDKGISIWSKLTNENTQQLMSNYHLFLNTTNIYEFES